jgi:2-phospho-L-lactate guanylyltransferase
VSRSLQIWAVVPVKEFADAKQRLAPTLAADQRRRLAAAMVQDVLAVLAAATGLAGIVVVTCDPEARRLAQRFGARVVDEHAREGQTAAVSTAATMLAREGVGGMLAVPGDIPLIGAAEVAAILAAHGPAPAFTIVPAHDRRGSNAVLCSPPDAVPLAFGNDSFLPHLAVARARGVEPTVLRLPGIGLDIDNPVDLTRLAERAYGQRLRVLEVLAETELDATPR